jgi:hypothetical protein
VFTVLRTFDNYFNANIILTKLQDAGIRCFLKDEYTVGIDPILSNAIGGIKLTVRKEDAFQAENLLRRFEDEYTRAIACPQCFSHNIILIPQAKKDGPKDLITWLRSIFTVVTENVYQCQQCGYECDTLPESKETYN